MKYGNTSLSKGSLVPQKRGEKIAEMYRPLLRVWRHTAIDPRDSGMGVGGGGGLGTSESF